MKTKIKYIYKFLIVVAFSLPISLNLFALDEILIKLKDKTTVSISLDSLKSIQFMNISGVKNNENNSIKDGLSYPNPFKENTVIEFDLSKLGGISNSNNSKPILIIYNLNNQLIKELDNFVLNNSVIIFSWDGRDTQNNTLPNGVYFYSIEINNTKLRGKVILNK